MACNENIRKRKRFPKHSFFMGWGENKSGKAVLSKNMR